MENRDLFISHLIDLSRQCEKNQEPKASLFLSSSEIDAIFHGSASGVFHGVPYVLYGGYEEAERQMAIFLPNYLLEASPNDIAKDYDFQFLIHLFPKNERFAAPISHRDVLGALMHRGIKRETIGDILVNDNEAYIYLNKTAYKEALELTQIKTTSVKIETLDLDQCPIKIEKEIFNISVASIRLDLIVSESFHCSREIAKGWINEGKAHLGSKSQPHNDDEPKPNEKIYVEGKGKLKYIGVSGTSKKGKIVLQLQRYK